ncbi:MAG: glycosyltransferase, partial [Acidobacteriota bacterium]
MRQEAELVPYTTTRLSGSPLLVLAPHPDDEIFGGGPILLEAVRADATIHVIVATNGIAQGDPETRREESREAARRLGIPAPEFWPFDDRSLSPSNPDLLEHIRQALDHHRPELLAIPSPAELHPDHRAMALAVYRALQEPGRLAALPPTFRLATYEISAFMRPNALVDITDDWPALMHASEAFSSQNDIQPYLEVLDAVAVARRLTLGPEVTRAAAFFVVDPAFIAEYDSDAWASQQGPNADPAGLPLLSPDPPPVGGDSRINEPQDPSPAAPGTEPKIKPTPSPAVRVSVVVRTKDRPELLREALQSLASQHHRPLQAIVINDGGIDVTDVVTAFEGQLEIIHEILEPGRGRCAAANRAIELASGPWLAFLDDDDVWLPDGIGRLLVSASTNQSAVYGTVTAFSIDPDTGTGTPFHTFGNPFDPDALLFENFIPIIGCLMPLEKVRSIGGIDESLECFEDWDLFLRLSRVVPFEFVDIEVAQYRIFGDGFITGAGGQELQHRGRTAIYEKHWSLLSPETLSRMQYHAKAELMPAEIARESSAWRMRVEDLERGNRNLEEGLKDREQRLEALQSERLEIDSQLDQAKLRGAALQQELENEPTRSALVSVIIVNYNGRHHLEKCLPSLVQSKNVNIEIIVVDNGSDDDSLTWLAEHYPNVRSIEIGANVGFGEGNRQGMLAARGGYAAFLNSDTVVEPGWLYELVYTARDPRVSGLGLAGLRDAVSFFRYADQDESGTTNPVHTAIDRAYIFGISQS